jgi:hypothetical protein
MMTRHPSFRQLPRQTIIVVLNKTSLPLPRTLNRNLTPPYENASLAKVKTTAIHRIDIREQQRTLFDPTSHLRQDTNYTNTITSRFMGAFHLALPPL